MEFVQTMSTTDISPTYTIDPEQQLRIKARYNATVRHTGMYLLSSHANVFAPHPSSPNLRPSLMSQDAMCLFRASRSP